MGVGGRLGYILINPNVLSKESFFCTHTIPKVLTFALS